jgi:hypothetical protein
VGPFAIVEQDTTPTIQALITKVNDMNLQQGIENSLDAKLSRAQEALDANNNGLKETVITPHSPHQVPIA